MQSEAHKDNSMTNDRSSHGTGNCPNCRALMPSELRFCRACGCRLGEGVAEYTETVRFRSEPDTAPNRKRATWPAPPLKSSADMKEFKAMARGIHEKTVKSMTAGLDRWKVGRACKRVPRWMVWVIVPIMIASMTGGFMSNSRSRRRTAGASASASASNSFLGSRYKTANGGAFIRDATPPGSAADKAGLVGGDVIISFDGKPVTGENDLTNLLNQTPVGKTVSVTYVRDGETKTTQVTTVSEKENDRLRDAFADRPEGKGFLGVDDDFKRVQVPGSNIYGVQIEVHQNRPADTAGLIDGDIVIEFDKTPIRTPEEFNTRIDRALPRSIVQVVVMRNGQRLEIPVRMGVE
jgi:hypothetical protein